MNDDMNDSSYFLDRSLGFLLGDSSRLLRKRFDRLARNLGMTRAQWRVIAILRRNEGINQTALADHMDIEPITLGRHIDRLADSGWVERRPDPDDRRAWRIFLTAKAQPVLAEMETIAIDVRDDAMADFTTAERERFIDDLIRIKGNLAASLRRDAADAADQPPPLKAQAGGGRRG